MLGHCTSPATKHLPPLSCPPLSVTLPGARPHGVSPDGKAGRDGEEGRPRHRAWGSPSSAEEWPKPCSRQRGRDSCCGGGRLRRERTSLETALVYTLTSHRSCPWNLSVGGRRQSLRGPGRNCCCKGDPLLCETALGSHQHPCPLPDSGHSSAGLWPRAVTHSADDSAVLSL